MFVCMQIFIHGRVPPLGTSGTELPAEDKSISIIWEFDGVNSMNGWRELTAAKGERSILGSQKYPGRRGAQPPPPVMKLQKK